MFDNLDLRSIKTEKALYGAMLSLLRTQNFKKTTVKEICEKALISRAAFYAHFIDKYDLLKKWLAELWSKHFGDSDATYEQIEKTVNANIEDKRRILKNLVFEADNETSTILFDLLVSNKNMTINRNCKETYHKNTVLSNFYAGGIISYLCWQIKNDFPSDMPLMNKELYKIIKEFHAKQLNKTKTTQEEKVYE